MPGALPREEWQSCRVVFRLKVADLGSWREAGPLNHLGEKADPDQ